MVKIEDIASVHLGKAGDGSVVKPYVTPDSIDSSLLVGVPRYLNRTVYGIDDNNLPFVGFDTWNCYEFSTLTTNGFPVCGVIRCVYPSNSPNIVESKSLKLYLNSFNMMRLADKVEDVITMSEEIIQRDVAKVLGCDTDDLQISFCDEIRSQTVSPINWNIQDGFVPLEYHVKVEDVEFNHFNEDPSILEVVPALRGAEYNWRSAVLRSNCRVTNQPDWGDIYFSMEGDLTVTPESLLQYIVSMRKENHFHEEICECAYKRLYDLLKPEKLLVACLYTRRGGIDINPVRATDYDIIRRYATGLETSYKLNTKTLRQ